MPATVVRHRLGFLLAVLAAVVVLVALRLTGIAVRLRPARPGLDPR